MKIEPERIYNPITEMGFSAMFTFQLDLNIVDTFWKGSSYLFRPLVMERRVNFHSTFSNAFLNNETG